MKLQKKKKTFAGLIPCASHMFDTHPCSSAIVVLSLTQQEVPPPFAQDESDVSRFSVTGLHSEDSWPLLTVTSQVTVAFRATSRVQDMTSPTEWASVGTWASGKQLRDAVRRQRGYYAATVRSLADYLTCIMQQVSPTLPTANGCSSLTRHCVTFAR